MPLYTVEQLNNMSIKQRTQITDYNIDKNISDKIYLIKQNNQDSRQDGIKNKINPDKSAA